MAEMCSFYVCLCVSVCVSYRNEEYRLLTSASSDSWRRQRGVTVIELAVDGQRSEAADKAIDVGLLQTVWSARLQQVRRQTSHVQRSEHVEHVAPVVVARYDQRFGVVIVDADAEVLLSSLPQFEQVPMVVVQ